MFIYVPHMKSLFLVRQVALSNVYGSSLSVSLSLSLSLSHPPWMKWSRESVCFCKNCWFSSIGLSPPVNTGNASSITVLTGSESCNLDDSTNGVCVCECVRVCFVIVTWTKKFFSSSHSHAKVKSTMSVCNSPLSGSTWWPLFRDCNISKNLPTGATHNVQSFSDY